MQTIATWPKIEKKFAEHGIEGLPRFVFKTTPVLDLKTERNIKNNKAIHLFYTQVCRIFSSLLLFGPKLTVELFASRFKMWFRAFTQSVFDKLSSWLDYKHKSNGATMTQLNTPAIMFRTHKFLKGSLVL